MKITKRQLQRIIKEEKAKLQLETINGESSLESVMGPVEDIVDKHINVMFYEIQTLLGVTEGDIAGMHWSDFEDRFMAMIKEYVQAEQYSHGEY